MSFIFKIKEHKTLLRLQELLKAKKIDEVVKECDLLLKKYPKVLHIYHLKYIALIQSQKYNEALECINEVIENKPNLNSYYQKASLLTNEYFKRYEEAIEMYNIIIQKEKKNADLYINKGIALACLKKYNEAEQCYDKAISLNPKNSYWAYLNKGVIKLNLKEYDEALNICDIALKRNKIPCDLDYLYITKARIYGKLNNKQKCVDNFKKAIQINATWLKRFSDFEELQLIKDCIHNIS